MNRRRIREESPERVEDLVPPKKSKFDSLLLEVENENLPRLKLLVNMGALVQTADQFTWNDLVFEEVPAIFAAIISSQMLMVEYLAKQHPHFALMAKTSGEDLDRFLLPTAEKLNDLQLSQLIDVLELVGAGLIFYGDPFKHGWACWVEAFKLRATLNGRCIAKSAPHSAIQKLAFCGETEWQDPTQLDELWGNDSSSCKTQAFFVSHRILSKYNCFPNNFAVCNLYKFALEDWKKRGIDPSRVFFTSLYLFELFEAPSFVQETDKPEHSFKVINLTLIELLKVLQDCHWTLRTLQQKDTILTFNHLMAVLSFSCNHQLKVQDSWPDTSPKDQHMELISDLIVAALKLLFSFELSENKRKLIKNCLETSICYYKYVPTEQKRHPLLRECSTPQARSNTEFAIVEVLLETGANVNYLHRQRCCAFNLLLKYLRINSNHLTFDLLMTALTSLCNHQLKVHDSWPEDASTKEQHTELISDLIHILLKRLVLIPQTPRESFQLRKCLANHIFLYEYKNEAQPNLLVRECTSLLVLPDTKFELVKLLLETGANPNSVDKKRRSALHILLGKELRLRWMWKRPNYANHVKFFTDVVRRIVIDDGRYHEDQVDRYGRTAYDVFKQNSREYPNPEVHHMLRNLSRGVRPLSCLAAKVVRQHQLPCCELPATVQSLVLQH